MKTRASPCIWRGWAPLLRQTYLELDRLTRNDPGEVSSQGPFAMRRKGPDPIPVYRRETEWGTAACTV